MIKRFTPDIYANKVTDIPVNFLKEKGIKLVFTDVDNTLAPHNGQIPMEGAIKWVEDVKKTGVKFIIYSNNHEERVKPFAEKYDMPYYFDAGKPNPKLLLTRIKEEGLEKKDCAMLGDQLFTDLLTAKNANILSVLVKPQFKDFKKTILIKRFFEKPFVKHLKYTIF